MRRFTRSYSQPCEVRKNEILKQEVDLTNDADDDDDEVHEIRGTETAVFGDSSDYASVRTMMFWQRFAQSLDQLSRQLNR
ncbi:hypothetical protein Bca52824_020270 [Brassica carinata]|uniref:Uncharacterized protein n=1 Tax=Brassica carinata TaxID=52824 RepID=A0A8X7VSB2_BRACI|nr:hypothetical protein Bca52824_020270 [Brassica carinata]